MSHTPATRLILVAHAPLASALHALVLHAYPECGADVEVLDVPAEASLEGAAGALRRLLLLDPARPSLLLVDAMGATPANAVSSVIKDFPQARAVAGMNLPMLWRTLCYRTEAPEQLVERALAGGQRGVTLI